jgi:hypothetical protein
MSPPRPWWTHGWTCATCNNINDVMRHCLQQGCVWITTAWQSLNIFAKDTSFFVHYPTVLHMHTQTLVLNVDPGPHFFLP